jgi:hypothetical protein
VEIFCQVSSLDEAEYPDQHIFINFESMPIERWQLCDTPPELLLKTQETRLIEFPKSAQRISGATSREPRDDTTYLCWPSSFNFSNAMTERSEASSPESVGTLDENLYTFKQLRMN